MDEASDSVRTKGGDWDERTNAGIPGRSQPGAAREGFADRLGGEVPVYFWLSKRRRRSCVFFGILIGVVILSSVSDFSPSHAVGWLLLPYFAYASFNLLRVGLDRRPRFEITAEGFVDRTSWGGGDLRIEWSDIRDVRGTTFGGRLEIVVRDPAKVRRKAGWPRRFWMFLGALYGKRTISIIPSSPGPSLQDLKSRIEDRLFEFERNQLDFRTNEPLTEEPDSDVPPVQPGKIVGPETP